MIDFRLYRVAWLPAVAAFVTMMFSLEGTPAPFEPAVTPTEFDADRAEANFRRILGAAEERTSGSEDASTVADLIAERFRETESGSTSEQEFEADSSGSQEDLRNVILTLPGESEQVILLAAARDSAAGASAPSSAAATAMLLELADVIGGSDHRKTFVIVSTGAGDDGAEGMRRFIESFGERDLIEAAVVIAQPRSATPKAPYVLRHSTDDRSTSIGLVRTAEAAIADQAALSNPARGLFSDLARLAMPVAYGEQAVLISEGVDAVAISSAGEAPLPPAADTEDTEEDLDQETLTQFGSATLGLLLALDQSLQPLEHGPEAYVEFSGSLVPGWAIAVLALSLIIPAGVAAFDGIARAARRRAGTVRSIAWAFGLALPLLGALIALYLLSLVGVVADPRYPFDPSRFDAGFGEILLLVALAAATAAAYVFGGLAHTPRRARREALVPALGAAAVAGALATWLLNPYLALLYAGAAHAWLIAARGEVTSRVLVPAGALLGLLPALLAYRSATGSVDAGGWDVVLMVADGHIATLALIALCPLMGALAGTVILAWRPGTAPREPLVGRPQGDGVTPQTGLDEGSINSERPKADE